jgi:F-type H+-transporting ATPase subunit gamma
VITRLLPFRTEIKHQEGHYTPEYLYEPGRSELLNSILPRALASMIYRAFLESITGEYGARMAAMDSATNNCKEMIRRLTLQMNRLRQAAITKELMDIVNGKEALG